MKNILRCLQGVIIYQDDILIYVPSRDTLSCRLFSVMKHFEVKNVNINKEKSVMYSEKMGYLGHLHTTEGFFQTLKLEPTSWRLQGVWFFSWLQQLLRADDSWLCWQGWAPQSTASQGCAFCLERSTTDLRIVHDLLVLGSRLVFPSSLSKEAFDCTQEHHSGTS